MEHRFSVDWVRHAPWSTDPLSIDEVLYEFEEPMLFSVRLGPQSLLMLKSGLDSGRDLYIGAIVAPEVIEAMKLADISVRAAITGGPMYVIELDGLSLKGYWAISRENLMGSDLPAEGVCLTDLHAKASDLFLLSHGPKGTSVTTS